MAPPHAPTDATRPSRGPTTARTDAARRTGPLRGEPSDLRAMKRALAQAPLGPKATLALTHAIIALEEDLGPHANTHGDPSLKHV